MLQNFDEWLLETDPELLEALDGWKKWAALGMLGLTGLAGVGAAKRHLVDGRPLSDRPNVFRTQQAAPAQQAPAPVQQAEPEADPTPAPVAAPKAGAKKAPLRLPNGTCELKGLNFTATGYGRLTTALGDAKGKEIALQQARQSANAAIARRLGTSDISLRHMEIVNQEVRDGMLVITVRGSMN